MDNRYIKSGRLDTLWKFYLRNNGDYDATYRRALQMGVSKSTAKDYMLNILSRVEKSRSLQK